MYVWVRYEERASGIRKTMRNKEQRMMIERKNMDSPCYRRSRSSYTSKTGQKICFVAMLVSTMSICMPLPPSGATAWIHGGAEAAAYP